MLFSLVEVVPLQNALQEIGITEAFQILLGIFKFHALVRMVALSQVLKSRRHRYQSLVKIDL
jgi:hypothetical protein